MKRWIVELEPNVWIAQWKGDPGMNLELANAKRFRSIESATISLAKARKHKQFLDAKIYEARP